MTTEAAYRVRWHRERYPAIRAEVFRPAPALTVSEWAAANRILAKGQMAGQLWRNEEAPYLVEIMDTISDPHRPRRACVMKSARVGYTEGVIGNGIGYFIDQEPADVIVMQPTDEEAGAYSVEHLDPLFHGTPALRNRLHLDSYKDSRNKIAYKKYAGGSLAIIGPKPSNLRRRSARIAFSDEIDELDDSHEQGDPLKRLDKRLDDFDDSLHFMGSTPTIKGSSRIEKEYAGSDQRRLFVRCPHCATSQPLEWGGKNVPHGISWDKNVHCKGCGAEAKYGRPCEDCGEEAQEVEHLPETAHYVCVKGCRIEEHEKRAMVQRGEWVATNPKGRYPGWHVFALMSLFPGARWQKLVEEWIEAQGDPEALKVFVNTVLGETYDEPNTRVEAGDLEDRAEQWAADVPKGVGVLTAAVDVQGDRLELLVRGWGLGEESWDILHERVVGEPESADTWGRLDALLTRPYQHANGGRMWIAATMVDAGYSTDAVYRFVKPREGRKVFACMGDAGREGAPPLKRPSRPNADGVKVFTLGVFGLKNTLLKRLIHARPGPRYIHLRRPDPKRCNGFDAEYFRQFGAERIERGIQKGSRRVTRHFVQTRARNEAIDLHAYNMAALYSLGAAVRELMPEWVEAAGQAPEPEPDADRPPPPPEPDEDWASGGGKWGRGW